MEFFHQNIIFAFINFLFFKLWAIFKIKFYPAGTRHLQDIIGFKGRSRLKFGLRQSFVIQVPTFSKLVSLIYPCRLQQKIKNPGSGLFYNLLKIFGGANLCFIQLQHINSALYNVLSMLIPKLDLPLNLTRHQKTNENIVPEIQYYKKYYTHSFLYRWLLAAFFPRIS